MKLSLVIWLVVSLQAYQYRELGMSVTLSKVMSLRAGCLANAKTIQPITDQVGTIIYFEKLINISLPPPYSDTIHYLPCNLPSSVGNARSACSTPGATVKNVLFAAHSITPLQSNY